MLPSYRSFYIVFIILLSFSNFAGATKLVISDNLQLREINDERVNEGFFDSAFNQDKAIVLQSGNNTFLIKYKDVYEDIDFAEERVVESELFIVKFNLVNQKKVILKTPEIKNLAAAERFSRTPEIILIDEHNQPIVLVLEKQSDYELAKQVEKAITALPEHTSDIRSVTKGHEVDQLENTSSSPKSINSEKEFSERVHQQAQNLPMLKYWWEKASAQEKKDFIEHVKGQ
jgi:uncharacterized protein YccT (UPF0319 family)